MEDMEELLKRYRPVGPPGDLRARVTAVRGDGGRAPRGSWLLVAATLLCAVLFYALAAQEHQRIAVRMPPTVADVPPEAPMEPWP